MGTRHLIMVRVDGQRKVAQYGQWDGYPTGQGSDIAEFIHSKDFNLETLKLNTRKLVWATEEEIQQLDPVENPEIHRDTGSKILKLICSGKIKKVFNSESFLEDSLFCEWAYELDLDNQSIDIYRGFQKNERGDYITSKKILTIPFNRFTSESLKQFEETMCNSENENNL